MSRSPRRTASPLPGPSPRKPLSAERVLGELQSVAFSDAGQVAGVNCPEDIADLPEDVRAAISGWTYDKDGRFCLRFWNKVQALELLAKNQHLLDSETPQQQTQVFVLIAPEQASSPEKWAELVQAEAKEIAARQSDPSCRISDHRA